jgi:hypothetical protein
VEHTAPTEENRASDVERVAVAKHVVPTADASPNADAANAEGALMCRPSRWRKLRVGPWGVLPTTRSTPSTQC